MERTKKPKSEAPIEIKGVIEVEKNFSPQLRWRKLGGGAFHWKNHIIKPGQTFLASVEEIPRAFIDLLECLDDISKVKETEKVIQTVPEILYKIEANEDFFDVVNIATGKTINEAPLTIDQAEELKTALEA